MSTIYVKAHRKRSGKLVRPHTKAGRPTSILKELKGLKHRQTKAIDDNVRHKEARRIGQLEKLLHKKKDAARVFRLRASRARATASTIGRRAVGHPRW